MSLTFFNKERADANVENAGKAPASTLKVDEVKAPAETPSEKEAPAKKTDAEKLKGNKE